jgi:hypothetical protein
VFDELDRVLGIERGPNGEPSVNDFLTIDLSRSSTPSPRDSTNYRRRYRAARTTDC